MSRSKDFLAQVESYARAHLAPGAEFHGVEVIIERDNRGAYETLTLRSVEKRARRSIRNKRTTERVKPDVG